MRLLLARKCFRTNRRVPSAFTLIELLVVISIIGILITVSVVGWVSVAARGRDSQRKSDLARVKQVLLQQYSDTRTYPVFDNSPGQIYSASWQLTAVGSACGHSDSNDPRLAVKYLDKIPIDPQDRTDYVNSSCADLAKNQAGRYLYLSAPTDSTGPSSPATGFALMAHLEQNQADWVTDSANPLKQAVAPFGGWYAAFNNYSPTIGVDANYLIDNRSQ